MIFQEWSCWIFALSANIVTASLHEFSPIFLSGSTQVHGRSPPPSLQHFHNPKTEQAFDFLPFPIFPALPASLSENSLHHWPFSVVHTFFGVTWPPRGLRGMLATFPAWAHYADWGYATRSAWSAFCCFHTGARNPPRSKSWLAKRLSWGQCHHISGQKMGKTELKDAEASIWRPFGSPIDHSGLFSPHFHTFAWLVHQSSWMRTEINANLKLTHHLR